MRRDSIRRLRAAALRALAISGRRSANHSFSCNFTRSHGGLPRLTSKPPCANTSGNARWKWKNWYWSASRLASASRPSGSAPPSTKSRRCCVVMPMGISEPARLGALVFAFGVSSVPPKRPVCACAAVERVRSIAAMLMRPTTLTARGDAPAPQRGKCLLMTKAAHQRLAKSHAFWKS